MDKSCSTPRVQVVSRPDDVRDVIRDMSAAQVRAYMARLGWHSDDRISPLGWGCDEFGKPVFGYSIWFTRWDWHGVHCDKRTFGDMVQSVEPERIDEVVRQAAETALRTWDIFVDILPGSANIHGEICPEMEAIQEIWRSTSNFEELLKGDDADV